MAPRERRAARKHDMMEYLENINPEDLGLYWEPKGRYIRAHGDCKSSVSGIFEIQTMAGADDKYHVTVRKQPKTILYVKLSEKPSAEDVLEALKSAAEKL